MSRLDWKRGRFDSDFETNEMNQGLRGFQSAQAGDAIDYYRFDRVASQIDDVYDEGDGAGRVYHPSVVVPVLRAVHDEGENANTDTGFYFNDNIYVTASFNQVFRTGLTFEDIRHEDYLKDRLVYDNKVFRVTQIHVMGQIQRRDVIISIEGTQVKADELVTDTQFAEFATQPQPNS